MKTSDIALVMVGLAVVGAAAYSVVASQRLALAGMQAATAAAQRSPLEKLARGVDALWGLAKGVV